MRKRNMTERQPVQTGWKWPTQAIVGLIVGATLASAWFAPRSRPEPAATSGVHDRPSAEPPVETKPLRATRRPLTHPLLACTSEVADVAELSDLRGKIVDLLAVSKRAGITRAAVHISDLETCHWFELGTEERFHPASLMKLPLALTWLERANQDPRTLQQRLTYVTEPGEETREDANAPLALHNAESYEVRDLLARMLSESRNDAKWLLNREVPTTELDATWRDLDLTPPARDRDPLVSVHDFALMFHALYDTAWLGRESSERALGWLAASTFKDGLVGQLPHDAMVAHKFGRRARQNPPRVGWQLQLHDCGILYRPGHPMLACVMTEALNEEAAKLLLQRVGALVWNYGTAQ